jgi:hypothetical protein
VNHIVAVDPKLAAKEIRELAKWAEHLRQALCGEPLELPDGFERGSHTLDLAGRVRSRMAWHYRRVWAFLNNGEPGFLPYDSELADLFSTAWQWIDCSIEERYGNDHYEFASEGTTKAVWKRGKRPEGLAPGEQWPLEVVTPSKRFVNSESVKSFVTRLLEIVDQIEAIISKPNKAKNKPPSKREARAEATKQRDIAWYDEFSLTNLGVTAFAKSKRMERSAMKHALNRGKAAREGI